MSSRRPRARGTEPTARANCRNLRCRDNEIRPITAPPSLVVGILGRPRKRMAVDASEPGGPPLLDQRTEKFCFPHFEIERRRKIAVSAHLANSGGREIEGAGNPFDRDDTSHGWRRNHDKSPFPENQGIVEG